MQYNKKIIFIKLGSFSHTNDSIIAVLKEQFPKYALDIVDIETVVKIVSFTNILYALFEYGPTMFISKKRFLECLLRNSYIFNKIKKEMNLFLKKQNYLFTFQTQSLFDISIKDVPNFIYTDHTFLVNKSYPGFDKREIAFFAKWTLHEQSIYENATLNFTMSSNVRNSIINDYNCPEDKVKCVYAGSNVDINNIMDISNDRYRSKNILFVGVNWERKGGPTLEKAFEIVLQKHPDATLTIVGCSPEIHLKNCEIIGKVPLKEVQKFYEQASIFCLPTTLEPFGMVFIEAMHNRLPLVATNIGAIPDFISQGKNGFKVDPGDSYDLADKLSLLLDSPKMCEEFGDYGYRTILKNYTWKNVGQLMKSYIIDVI